MGTELYLAWRYLFRGGEKHISFIGVISCCGVILGVATVIVALAIVNGVDGGLMERIMEFRDHLTIESSDASNLDRVKQVIDKWEEVETSAITLQTQVFAKFDNMVVPLAVKGIDFNEQGGKKLFSSYIKEEFSDTGFFVGESLSRRFSINEKIEFYPLRKKLALQEEKVRGIFSVGLYDIDNYYIITDLEKAKELSENYLLVLGVKVKDPFAAGKLKKKIQADFPRNIFINTWIETNQALFSTLRLERIAMFVILTLIIIIASFNIFATLTVKVVEKTKDIGILKALGFTNRMILSIFTLQGVMLGIIGIFGGTLLGLGACYVLDTYPIIRLPQEIFFTEYLPVSIQQGDIIMIAAVSLVISFISSLFPALRASRLNVCEALRYE